jgi:hypothetical protein
MIAVFNITLSYRPFAGKVAAKKYGLILTRDTILPLKRKRDSTRNLVTFGARQVAIVMTSNYFASNEIQTCKSAVVYFL